VKIAVLGTGRIGSTLGRAFARAGHDITFGARDPQRDAYADDDSGARVADIAGALDGADVVVLAVPGPAVAGLVREHAQAFGGVLVVDCANNVAGPGPANSHDVITAAAPGVRYARAFNTLGVENLQDPRFGDTVADMFFSSSESDRGTVEELIEAVGLRPVWLGDDAQNLLDGVLRLWFTLSGLRGRHLAFKVLDGTSA
jgi:predicted dinucleotide-binding enzyme